MGGSPKEHIDDIAGSDSVLGKDDTLGGNSGQVNRVRTFGGTGIVLNSLQRMGSRARTQANEAAAAAAANMPKPTRGMPFVDPANIAQNRARRFLNLQRRSGRQSTLLTQQTNSLNTFG